ncbi:pectate lyase [Caulobacter sp. D5]|uniref:pectate lyase n=2 Tax=unclassified Caulobacter TaxID=2648921 RepID=UPI000D725634|nr:pectate lyase [Caulobacter sp. D5]PXA96082.1 pectate lyase [Caulobacter sp. D5]
MPLSPLTRRRLMATTAAAFAASAGLAPFKALAAEAPGKDAALATMKRATTFMVEKVAYQGGYVWSYLPDFSRRWGEMEAYPTMIWVQPPGTATMGHLFLDAYHATGDEYYYEAAKQVAGALIKIQHPAGGWNYLGDLAGEQSIRKWYDTIGKNGWRLEEFQHYYGNATFDDAGTAESAQFLLRLYVEKKDPAFKPALDKAIGFVLDSQYPVGGWPQRFPLKDEFHHHGRPDYTGFITFNDDVAGENIEFLIMVWQALGDPRALPAIKKAMDCFVACQQPQPQPGWGLQHRVADLKPAGARTYEPEAFATHTTAANITACMGFYELTGDPKYLARLSEALDWLETLRLPVEYQKGRAFPTFVEIGTGKPLYVHRTGSNVVNGRYYVDQNPENTVAHYSSFRGINIPALRRRLETLKATPPEVASKASPLKAGRQALPKYFTLKDVSVSDLNVGALKGDTTASAPDKVAGLIAALNEAGWWPTELKATSNPYIGDGSATPAPGDFSRTHVGDASDTSPYVTDKPKIGISTGSYIENMVTLLKYVGAA